MNENNGMKVEEYRQLATQYAMTLLREVAPALQHASTDYQEDSLHSSADGTAVNGTFQVAFRVRDLNVPMILGIRCEDDELQPPTTIVVDGRMYPVRDVRAVLQRLYDARVSESSGDKSVFLRTTEHRLVSSTPKPITPGCSIYERGWTAVDMRYDEPTIGDVLMRTAAERPAEFRAMIGELHDRFVKVAEEFGFQPLGEPPLPPVIRQPCPVTPLTELPVLCRRTRPAAFPGSATGYALVILGVPALLIYVPDTRTLFRLSGTRGTSAVLGEFDGTIRHVDADSFYDRMRATTTVGYAELLSACASRPGPYAVFYSRLRDKVHDNNYKGRASELTLSSDTRFTGDYTDPHVVVDCAPPHVVTPRAAVVMGESVLGTPMALLLVDGTGTNDDQALAYTAAQAFFGEAPGTGTPGRLDEPAVFASTGLYVCPVFCNSPDYSERLFVADLDDTALAKPDLTEHVAAMVLHDPRLGWAAVEKFASEVGTIRFTSKDAAEQYVAFISGEDRERSLQELRESGTVKVAALLSNLTTRLDVHYDAASDSYSVVGTASQGLGTYSASSPIARSQMTEAETREYLSGLGIIPMLTDAIIVKAKDFGRASIDVGMARNAGARQEGWFSGGKITDELTGLARKTLVGAALGGLADMVGIAAEDARELIHKTGADDCRRAIYQTASRAVAALPYLTETEDLERLRKTAALVAVAPAEGENALRRARLSRTLMDAAEALAHPLR